MSYFSKVILVLISLGIIYTGYKVYIVRKYINLHKEILGYNVSTVTLHSPVFKSENWRAILIDSDISYTDGAHNLVPYDLDKDGKIELIANSYRSDALIYYKYNTNPHDPSDWSRYIIDSSVGGGIPRTPVIKYLKSLIKENLIGGYSGGAHYTAISDMNNNGSNDLIVAGDFKRNDVIWYESIKDSITITGWVKHVAYENNNHRTYHVETGHIDKDEYLDIVFATKSDNSVGWIKNIGTSSEWPITWIDTNCKRCFNVRVADIDNDGQNEIIASEDDSMNGGKLHIYRYLSNPTLTRNWNHQTIANFPTGHGVSVFEIIDIDFDGDLDFVTGNHQGDVYIIENSYPFENSGEWKKYKINNYNVNNGHDFREIDVGDMDNDGDLDIVVANEGMNMVMWFENSGLMYQDDWKIQVIDKSDLYLKWCHSIDLEDIDRDGDLDIAVAAAGSNTFLLYFNNINTF